jgi:hypothetical protein
MSDINGSVPTGQRGPIEKADLTARDNRVQASQARLSASDLRYSASRGLSEAGAGDGTRPVPSAFTFRPLCCRIAESGRCNDFNPSTKRPMVLARVIARRSSSAAPTSFPPCIAVTPEYEPRGHPWGRTECKLYWHRR